MTAWGPAAGAAGGGGGGRGTSSDNNEPTSSALSARAPMLGTGAAQKRRSTVAMSEVWSKASLTTEPRGTQGDTIKAGTRTPYRRRLGSSSGGPADACGGNPTGVPGGSTWS